MGKTVITIKTKAVLEYPIIMKSKNVLCLLLLFVSLIVVMSALFVYSKSMWKSDQILQQVPFGDTTKATYFSKVQTMVNSFQIDSPSWTNTETEDMSAKDVFEYFEWSNHSSCQLINDFGGRFMDGTLKGHRFYDGQKA